MTEKDWMLNWLLTSGDFEVAEEDQENDLDNKELVNTCNEKAINA